MESTNHTWQSVQSEILRRISERIWHPGYLVPKEIDLAREFDCSRGTINRAMREMADAGVLERKRKAGTRVAQNPVKKTTLEIPVIRLNIENRGESYRHALLDKEVVNAPALVASKLSLPIKTQMLHLQALHFANEQPFLFEDRWVNHLAFPDILEADFTTINANEWLMQNAPLTTGDISFSATNANQQEAEMLATEQGMALFVTTRSTWVGDIPVTNVRLTYKAGYQMHSKL